MTFSGFAHTDNAMSSTSASASTSPVEGADAKAKKAAQGRGTKPTDAANMSDSAAS